MQAYLLLSVEAALREEDEKDLPHPHLHPSHHPILILHHYLGNLIVGTPP